MMEDQEKFTDNDNNLPMPTTMDFPDALPLLMLSDQVVFPMSLLPVHLTVSEEKILVTDSAKGHRLIVLATRRPGEQNETKLSNAYEVGCIARILQVQAAPDGGLNVLLQASKRVRITGLVRMNPYLVVRVQPMEDIVPDPAVIAPIALTVKTQMGNLIRMNPNLPDGAQGILENVDDPAFLTDLVAANLNLKVEEKQILLEIPELKERMMRLVYFLQREIDLMEASTKIRQEVQNSIEKGQREFFLRQQLKAIEEELGQADGKSSEIAEYRNKITALKLAADIQKELLREVDRLARMNDSSADYQVAITYLDTVLELPWNNFSNDNLDIRTAESILDQDHYGLGKVKKRILEYLAVRKLKPDAHGPILCFQGPPGVGKTSLGQSIARALGRKFVRAALGGMHDEAEIRGHRKTYVGALPGRIIQGIRKCGSNNPVFMLDEIDKLGNDFRGDPSSALLEVLDPAQNHAFVDNYVNLPFDLSKVMFIATANVLDTIPWALRDRMEIIELPGYTQEEKIQIARRYLVPRQRSAHGLSERNIKFSIPAIRKIVSDYTREAGVRNLEREIANVCRGAANKFARGRRNPINIGPEALREYLGNEKVFYGTVERTRTPGVVVGLAWTPTGGDILFIEATRMPGKGGLILTGQLGDVMKESAQAALSYLRARAKTMNLPENFFSEFDIHIHVPAGAVPKDGPSAGVAMLTALASMASGVSVKSGLAMTGEITLRGLVLPVGGIKEKVLAAARAGVKQIILPQRCKNDLDDVPESVRKKIKFHFVSKVQEVLHIALRLEC